MGITILMFPANYIGDMYTRIYRKVLSPVLWMEGVQLWLKEWEMQWLVTVTVMFWVPAFWSGVFCGAIAIVATKALFKSTDPGVTGYWLAAAFFVISIEGWVGYYQFGVFEYVPPFFVWPIGVFMGLFIPRFIQIGPIRHSTAI